MNVFCAILFFISSLFACAKMPETSDIKQTRTVDTIKTKTMKIIVNNKTLTATLANNSSAKALTEALKKSSITITMKDYANMEKVGELGITLPRNDQQITTQAGDIILYQGNKLVIYYAPNSWNFTRLGKIDDISAKELKNILGSGNVEITLME